MHAAPETMAEDVRRRRAERVRQDRVKNAVSQYGKYVLIALVAIAAIGLAAAVYKPPPVEKFAHEHPAYALYIEGEHVTFNHPDYDARAINDKVHIHYRGDEASAATWHVEANFPNGIPDLTLQQIFAQYGLTFRHGYLKLDTKDGHNGTEWPDRGDHRWRVFVSKVVVGENGNERQPFTEVPGDYSQYVPRDFEKILITYGNLTAEQIQMQQQAIPEPRP